MRVRALKAPRPFVRLGAGQAAILRFRLPRRAVVIFEVRQLAPVCRPVGLFRANGRAGANRVRFAGRVAGRRLTPGTYELRARGFARIRVRIAVLARGATVATAGARLRANACVVTAEPEAALVDDAGGTATSGTSNVAEGTGTATATAPAPAPSARAEPPREALPASQPATPQGEPEGRSAGGALGRFVPGEGDFGVVSLVLLIVGTGAALLMLAGAAMPDAAARGPGAVVADRRLELALGGTATLLVVTVAYLLAVS